MVSIFFPGSVIEPYPGVRRRIPYPLRTHPVLRRRKRNGYGLIFKIVERKRNVYGSIIKIVVRKRNGYGNVSKSGFRYGYGNSNRTTFVISSQFLMLRTCGRADKVGNLVRQNKGM